MLKNWLVKTKQIKKKAKGFINHINYLVDDKRVSHKGSTISVLNDASKEIIDEIDKRKSHRQEKGLRGGGVSNFATSFIVSLPEDIKQPNKDEWRQIGLYGIKKIAQSIGVDYKDLKKISHIVLHEEKDKSNHIHVLVGNVLNNEVIKGVSQYKATHAMKKSVNYSVKQLLNEDNNKYIPKNQNVGKKPLFMLRAEKAEAVMKEFKLFAEKVNSWAISLFNKKATFLASKSAANALIDFEDVAGLKMANKVLEPVEEIEEELELPRHSKVTPKVKEKRKRRRREPKKA